jgi:hypothetical protein
MLALYGNLPFFEAAIIYGKSIPIEASNFPKWTEGRHLAYPTTSSLLLRAEDRLRLFRKLLEKVLSKMLQIPPHEGHPAVDFCTDTGKQHMRDFNPLAD